MLVLIAFGARIFVYQKYKGRYVFHNRENLYLTVFFLSAALIMGLRNVSVGADTHNYSRYFEQISQSNWKQIIGNIRFLKYDSLEIGYVTFVKICSILNENYIFSQLILSLFFCLSMAYFYKDNVKSKIILTTVFLGCGLYLLAFNINRQMIAVALTMLSWNCLLRQKKIRTVLLLLLAMTFHISAIVFLFAYFVYMFRKNKIALEVIITGVVIASINYRYVVNFISEFLSVYNRYFGNVRTKQTIGMSILLYGIILILAGYIFFNRGKFGNLECLYAIFSSVYVICNFIGVYFNYFERIGLYFLPFVVFEMDIIAKKIKAKSIARFYTAGVTISFSLYFLLSSTSTQYIYKFFWE